MFRPLYVFSNTVFIPAIFRPLYLFSNIPFVLFSPSCCTAFSMTTARENRMWPRSWLNCLALHLPRSNWLMSKRQRRPPRLPAPTSSCRLYWICLLTEYFVLNIPTDWIFCTEYSYWLDILCWIFLLTGNFVLNPSCWMEISSEYSYWLSILYWLFLPAEYLCTWIFLLTEYFALNIPTDWIFCTEYSYRPD